MSNTSRASVFKGAAWIALSRIFVNAIGLVSMVVLARLLLPSDFGLVALAKSISMVVGALTELSLVQSLIQHRDPRDHHFNTAWTLNAIRSLILALVMVVLAGPSAELYGDDRLRAYFSCSLALQHSADWKIPSLSPFKEKWSSGKTLF